MKLEFFSTPVSPWTYLGMRELRRLTDEYGLNVEYKPVDIGQLFKTSGTKPVHLRPEPVQKYRKTELARWRDFRDMPLTLEPKYFPTSPILACKMILAAQAGGADAAKLHDLSEAVMRACWAEEKDVGDETTAIEIANQCGFDGGALKAIADSGDVDAALQANTDAAIAYGAWGSPSYVLDGELFWGQDKLQILEWRAKQSA